MILRVAREVVRRRVMRVAALDFVGLGRRVATTNHAPLLAQHVAGIITIVRMGRHAASANLVPHTVRHVAVLINIVPRANSVARTCLVALGRAAAIVAEISNWLERRTYT